MKTIVMKDISRIKSLLLDVLHESEYKSITRLGGMTNHTYKIVLNESCTYVVRLPGEGTEALINRSNEKISTMLACNLGIDAPLLYFGQTGEKISRYIDGAKTMSAESIKNSEILRKVAAVFHTLHTCGVDTAVSFDVFDMAAGYEQIIYDNAVSLFDNYDFVKSEIMNIREYVETNFSPVLVPCHNDPLCENWVLDRNGKLHLIDWEYAGMNDCMWDLADFSIEAFLNSTQDSVLLFNYLGREPNQSETIRFHANKLYLDFLWALWGKARSPFDGKEMEQYGNDRYVRLTHNLADFLAIYTIH